MAVAALDKDAREELDEINVFLANVSDKVAPEKLDKVLGCVRPPSAACAGKLAGKLCGQAFKSAFDKVRARGA